MMNSFCFLLILCVPICLSVEWMVKSPNSSARFDHIYFPVKDNYFIQGSLFNDNIMMAPRSFYAKTGDAIDFCADTRKVLSNTMPSIWNDSTMTTPCQAYFCGANPPSLMPRNKSFDIITDLLKMMANPDVLSPVLYARTNQFFQTFNEAFVMVMTKTFNSRAQTTNKPFKLNLSISRTNMLEPDTQIFPNCKDIQSHF